MKHILAILVLLLPLSANATYWSFNLDSLAPTTGSGSMTAFHTGIGVDTFTYLAGTTENAPSGYPAGSAASFVDLINAFSSATIQGNVNLSSDTNISLSFAFKTDHLFGVGEYLEVYYSTGSGWIHKTNLTPPALNTWTIYQIALPELDHQTNAGFRIVSNTTVAAGKYTFTDNVQIVPEPSTYALLILTGFLALCWKRRKTA